MTIKQALNQLREADREIEILENVRAEAFAQATRVTSTITDSGIKRMQDPHGFDGLTILDDELCRKINALVAAKAAAVRLIYSLEEPRYREVLAAYYVNGRMPDGHRKTWENVADELFLSLRCVMLSHKMALDSLSALYPDTASVLRSIVDQ